MQLKLSTLLLIIGAIFFAHYYFTYPCIPVQGTPQHLPPQHLPHQQLPPQQLPPVIDNGMTILDIEPVQEHFGLTLLEDDNVYDSNASYNVYDSNASYNVYDSNDIYDLAGNIRPDNVNITML